MVDAIKNRKSQDFSSDLQLAIKVEECTVEWLQNTKQFSHVQRIEGQKGHDIILTKEMSYGEEKRKIEIKRDFWVDQYTSATKKRNATNNICLELWSNKRLENKGWTYYTDSEYIYYIGNDNIYILDTIKVKEFATKTFAFTQSNEPFLKKKQYKNNIMFTNAHHNGNTEVRNAMIHKNILINEQCIIKIMSREKFGFNRFSTKYGI